MLLFKQRLPVLWFSGVWLLFLLLASIRAETVLARSPATPSPARRPPVQQDRAIANHLLLGNPSRADGQQPNNWLLVKPQYALSYNRDRGTANWVSWQLNTSWLGTISRQDTFRADPMLPKSWRILPTSYQGSGYERGHLLPSGDRKRSINDNHATFTMTNIVPQAPEHNVGAWKYLEEYCRELAEQGRELYIIAGVQGEQRRIAQGRVVVPAALWKVVVVLEKPGLGLAGVTPNTRVIAVKIPNVDRQGDRSLEQISWREFVTTVDHLETLTGYDLLDRVSPDVQRVIEARVDASRWPPTGAEIDPITEKSSSFAIGFATLATVFILSLGSLFLFWKWRWSKR